MLFGGEDVAQQVEAGVVARNRAVDEAVRRVSGRGGDFPRWWLPAFEWAPVRDRQEFMKRVRSEFSRIIGGGTAN